VSDLVFVNPFFRKLRIVFVEMIKPWLIKALLASLLLLVLALLGLKIFKPDFLQRFYTESLYSWRGYFFAKLNGDHHEFSQINIVGNKRVSRDEIVRVINEAKKNQPEFLIQNIIDEIKTQLLWINKITITRTMPNILNVAVVEFVPFAIWQNDGAKYLIDKEGNLVPFEDLEEFRHMVILSGDGANTHVRSLFNLLTIDPLLSKNIFSAVWVGVRRWDIRFENGLLVKLPETNIAEAWQHLIKINNMPGSLTGLKMIDLRVLEKIYLEYDDSVIKEMKEL